MILDKNITITGALGSGKSLVCKKLKEALDFEIISVGAIQRKLAEKYKLSTTDFNIYMETHPEIDIECDNMVATLGKEKNSAIFDSRLAWHFVPHSFKIYLSVVDEIAAQRIYLDKNRINESYTDASNAKDKIRERRESEILRFKKQYNVTLNNFSNYDLVIDTSYSTPENISTVVLEAYKHWANKETFYNTWLPPKNIITLSNNNVSQYTKQNPPAVIKVKEKFYSFDELENTSELIPVHIIYRTIEGKTTEEIVKEYIL